MVSTPHPDQRVGAQAAAGWDARPPRLPGVRTDVASDGARRAATQIDLSTVRRNSTPVRRAFVRGLEEPRSASPLLSLYRGGRSGVVPIKVYLALLWRCSAAPFSTQAPARAWATLLDLDDPGGAGARRVRDAITKLAARQLIATESSRGELTSVTLLRDDGTGRTYSIPSSAYVKADSGRRGKKVLDQHRYFKINSDLWTTGVLQVLSGPALVMLLILLSEGGDRGDRIWFSTELFKERYGISPATRAKGIRELVERGLVTVDREALPDRPGGKVFERLRYRDVYTLTGVALIDEEGRAARRSAGDLRFRPTPDL